MIRSQSVCLCLRVRGIGWKGGGGGVYGRDLFMMATWLPIQGASFFGNDRYFYVQLANVRRACQREEMFSDENTSGKKDCK